MISQRKIYRTVTKTAKKNAPIVQPWNGVPMIRNQSFLASVKEIIDYSDEIDVVRIGLIGAMMSGKSTLAKSIGHAIHKYSKMPFTIRIFYKNDLKNFKETVSKLEPANYILIFDDVSFLKANTSSQGISMIEDEVSTIRHFEDEDGKKKTIDVKIILIFNFHYPKALPPFLREFDFKYITTIGTDNDRVIAENYGADNVDLVKNFKSMRKRAVTNKAWFEPAAKWQEPVMYKWRDPFIPVLFWNETNMRKIVTPTRYFMDEICSICNEAEGNMEYDEKTIQELIETGRQACNPPVFNKALKLLMEMHGYKVHSAPVQNAKKWIERERMNRNIPLTVLAKEAGIEIIRTRIDKKSMDEIKSSQ